MAVGLLAFAWSAQAQWVKYPTPGLARTKDGKPNLNAPAPRTSDGRPDLTGVWQAEGAPIPVLMKLLPGGENGLGEDIPSQYFVNVFADFERGKEPLQPAALTAAKTLSVSTVRKDTAGLNCLPSGMPIFITAPAPFKIVEAPGEVIMMSESDTSFRQIFTDGRPLPADPQPQWLGSSVGRWDGDTFVVETVGFNDRADLDALGHRHSTALRLTERYHRANAGRMNVEMTFTDPKTLTRPVTIRFDAVLRPDTELIEYFCAENEKDRQRIPATN
jgi:hypothetical protein